MSGTTDTGLRILLVEDNPNDARLIRRHLSGADSAFLPDTVDLDHVESLEEAVGVIESDGVDLVLLDLGLPGSSGKETFERANESISSVPIVVLTNLRDEQTAVELLQQGAQDYLNKGSLSEENLVKSIRYAMERKEREQQLQTTTEQLEVLNRILRHDVQNDIQVLQMWSQGLLDDVAPEHEDDVRRILQTSEHIKELTENSRDFIRAVTGKSKLETEPTRLDRILRDELQKARSRYEDADFVVDGSLPGVTVVANGLLSSVFRNLLNNAVQHNRDRAHVELGVENSGEVTLVRVTDDGPGVPDEQKTEIFGKGEHGLESEGTGIGLYLVHTLVAEFGGEVWVEDRTDGQTGATFVVELQTADEWIGSD